MSGISTLSDLFLYYEYIFIIIQYSSFSSLSTAVRQPLAFVQFVQCKSTKSFAFSLFSSSLISSS